jgi:predicted amidohydrolase
MQRTTISSVGLTQPDDPINGDRLRTNLDSLHAALDIVERHDPDLVVFPELTLHRGDSRNMDIACSVPGSETDEIGEHARELETHVVLPMSERDGDRLYNAAVLIDDAGEVIGSYRKIRPTVGEVESGKTPGADTAVWDTPFGRVGVAICFDVHFQEIAMSLAAKRTDLVVFPSAFAGDEMLRGWAINHGFYVVQCNPDVTAVYTPGGNRMAANDDRNYALQTPLSTGAGARIGVTEVNTDFAQVHLDTIINEYEAIMDQHGDALRLHKCSTEAYAVLKSVGEVSVETVLEEFDIETKQSYLERSRQAAVEAQSDSSLDTFASVPTLETGD